MRARGVPRPLSAVRPRTHAAAFGRNVDGDDHFEIKAVAGEWLA